MQHVPQILVAVILAKVVTIYLKAIQKLVLWLHKYSVLWLHKVFNWVSYNQNQSIHSRQSQRIQTIVNQSKLETNTCNRRKAREDACERVAIDFGFRPRAHYAEEFEKGFTLKMYQLFSVHTTPEKFQKRNNDRPFWICVLRKTTVREISWLSWRHRFRKAPFSKYFPSTRKWEAGVFKLLFVQKHFLKALFSWPTSLDSRPNGRKNASFSNSCGLI